MSRVQAAFVVVLALLIGYGAGYSTHLIHLPAGISQKAYRKALAEGPPPKYQHPLVAIVERARSLKTAGKLTEAQKLLREQLHIYPQAEAAQGARDLLGQINTELFFSDKNLYGKIEHVVEKGDSLARIARKLKSTPEMIMRANNLDSTMIHPGDRLLVPDGEFTLTIDLPNERVVVHHGDAFFKQYPIKALDLPPSRQTRVTTKVQASVFWKDGERVSPSSPEIAEATPWIHLARSGYILYGVAEEGDVDPETVEVSEKTEEAKPEGKQTTASDPDIPPRGIALIREDLVELQLFLRRGTPVTIIRSRD